MSLGSQPARAVAIVTGGSSRAGCDAARELAGWDWPIVLVYLEDQSQAEATAAEIISAGGTTVAVRADLADALDVERIFTESTAAFGSVDVVLHTTTDSPAALYLCAARHVSRRGLIVSTRGAEAPAPQVASLLREREIRVEHGPPDAALGLLEKWRQNAVG
jgi:short chain dehydrogenase